MWPDIIQKAKDGGLDVIESYVFWNMHEPKQNEYYFEDRFDLVKFVKIVQQVGLLVQSLDDICVIYMLFFQLLPGKFFIFPSQQTTLYEPGVFIF
jgi:hypothetical protein